MFVGRPGTHHLEPPGVHLQRDRDVSVPELPADPLGRLPREDVKRRERMPHRVGSEVPLGRIRVGVVLLRPGELHNAFELALHVLVGVQVPFRVWKSHGPCRGVCLWTSRIAPSCAGTST